MSKSTGGACFIDMDRTLLTVNTGTLWMRYLRKRGEISRLAMLRAGGWAVLYRLAILDMDTLARRLVADLEGQSEHDMRKKCDDWYAHEVKYTVARPGLEAMARHRALGQPIVLLTGGTQFVAEPLAAELRLDAVLCSRIEAIGGTFTGKLIEPLCVGAGKIHWAEGWARQRGIDLAASSFYTDSYNDLPMMERVGTPVAVNPDVRLRRTARRRGWAIQHWDNP